jgi:hypothetical protein
MDDYSALAQRVTLTVGDARGCLILSRDGLVLGAFPEDESAIKPFWLKFATLGEPLRSFVEFGDQTWAYVHRGAYAAFVVAGTGVRPGILIDQMEQALLTAEEARTKREPLRVPESGTAPSGKPRTSLHPAAEREQPAEVAEVTAAPAPSAEDRGGWSKGTPVTAGGGADLEPPADPEPPVAAEAAPDAEIEASPAQVGTEPAPASALKKEPQRLVGSGGDGDAGDEIDRVMLAKEFSGLLQLDEGGDEEGS